MDNVEMEDGENRNNEELFQLEAQLAAMRAMNAQLAREFAQIDRLRAGEVAPVQNMAEVRRNVGVRANLEAALAFVRGVVNPHRAIEIDAEVPQAQPAEQEPAVNVQPNGAGHPVIGQKRSREQRDA